MTKTLDSESPRQLVNEKTNKCYEYCRSLEAYPTERFSIEHILPRALGGLTVADNPALACQGGNRHPSSGETTISFRNVTPPPQALC